MEIRTDAGYVQILAQVEPETAQALSDAIVEFLEQNDVDLPELIELQTGLWQALHGEDG